MRRHIDAMGSYRPDIDGLKGLAILFVFVFHYADSWLPGGFIGVDIFFVISGYLIGRSVFETLESKKFKLATYFAHRARRIFPSLIVMLLVLLVLGWFVLLPNEFESLGKHIGAASVFISNWLLWREVGYFDTAAELKPLLNLWSLGLEEQFYLIFPGIVFLGALFKGRIFLALALCFIATLVASQANIGDMKAWAYFHPLSRLWELLAGSMLAYAQLRNHRWLNHLTVNDRRRLGLSAVGLGFLFVSAFAYTKSMVFPGVNALLPIAGAVLVIAAGANTWLGKHVLSNTTLIRIGLISYPLYLWHWPLLSLVKIIDGAEPGAITKTVLALITVLVSIASYVWIEKPVRFGGLRKIKWMPVFLWVLLLAIGSAGYAVYKKQGFPERLGSHAIADIDMAVLGPVKGKVVLVGDSHGLMYERALKQLYARQGYELVSYNRGGCLPLWNIERHDPGYQPDGCPKTINEGISYALNTADVRKVIIIGSFVGMGNIYDVSRPETDAVKSGRTLSDSEKWALFEKQFKATAALFEGSGKKLQVFHVIPELDFDPVACEYRPLRIASQRKSPCATKLAKVEKRQSQYREIVSRVQKSQGNIVFFDPVPVLCDLNTCAAESSGTILYGNATHLNEVGAKYVLEKYQP